MTKEKGVIVSKNGPYIITGSIPLSKMTIATTSDGDSEKWEQGQTFPLQEKYALCRCGQSKQKPFCDGTHAQIGFVGTETASREPYLNEAKVFDGPNLQLSDLESLCAFGRFCDPNGKVWNQVTRTSDPHVRATFIRQVENCPAGRLVAWDKATEKSVEPKLPFSIGLVEDPGEQRLVVAARSLAGISQADLASACEISVETLKRMESDDGAWLQTEREGAAISRALNNFGVVFIPEGD